MGARFAQLTASRSNGTDCMFNKAKSRLLSVGLGLLVWAMAPSMAMSQGQTVVLRVPVEVSKIYETVTGIEVRCNILDASDQVIKDSGHLKDVKGLVDGALSDIFEIVIALSDEEAKAARRYQCNLFIGWGYGLEPRLSSSTSGPDFDEQFPQRQARPDEFFRTEVSGDLISTR
jgi:hypothetical protein